MIHKREGSRLPRHFVATAYVVDQGRVLLVHHRKIGLWLPAGGHLEEGEDPAEAAVREVQEETGLKVRILSKVALDGHGDGVRVLPTPHHLQIERIEEGPHEHIDLVFVCKVVSGRVRKNAESLEVRWFTPEDIENSTLMDKNVRHFAKAILSETTEPEE